MISKDKTYRTRDGREVRIYATDGDYPFVVHGAIKKEDGQWELRQWLNRGCATIMTQSDRDLIEVKPRIKRTVWLHVYTNGYVEASSKPHWRNGPCINGPYDGEKPIACVKVEIDCEEGEGL
jgi:hypothetical protein